MEGKKALLKIREKYYYPDQYICFEVVAADAGLFFIHPGEGKVKLAPGVDIDKDLLKSVRSEAGLPVEIEAYNAEDERMELFLDEEGEDEEDGTGRKAILMLACKTCEPNQFSLRGISRSGEIVQILPADFGGDIEGALEILRDCEGISSAEFSGGQFIIEVDPRVSQNKILRDIENWLGSCLAAKLDILTVEEYRKRYSASPLCLSSPPNQLKLKFP